MAQTDAATVAKWFLWRAQQETHNPRVSNKKLQKLVYYAQAWHLADSGHPLFDDKLQAWIHGPVVESLYHEYKQFGWHPIVVKFDSEPAVDGDTREHLEEIWDEYGGYDADYLELLTHQETPWQMAREYAEFTNPWDTVIEHNWMLSYYQGLRIELLEDADA